MLTAKLDANNVLCRESDLYYVLYECPGYLEIRENHLSKLPILDGRKLVLNLLKCIHPKMLKKIEIFLHKVQVIRIGSS